MNPDIQKAFHEAVKKNDVETARRMIAAGADVNAAYDEHGYRALMHACDRGCPDMIKMLLTAGADMYIETYASKWDPPYTAAMIVADDEDWARLKMLLDCGYDVNHKNSRGITLLMLCSGICWSSGVQSLLEYGAYPSIKDLAGQTALFYATCYNNVCYDEIIDYLIEYGANINEVDSDGNTALLQIAHEEIEGDRTHLALIARGIDVNIRNNTGETALSIARKHGHEYLIRELLAAGATDN